MSFSSDSDDDFVIESLVDDLDDIEISGSTIPEKQVNSQVNMPVKNQGSCSSLIDDDDDDDDDDDYDFAIESLVDDLDIVLAEQEDYKESKHGGVENEPEEFPRVFIKSHTEKAMKTSENEELISSKIYSKSKSVEDDDLGIEFEVITHKKDEKRKLSFLTECMYVYCLYVTHDSVT